MARRASSISIRRAVLNLFPDEFVRRLARATRTVKRRRKVDPVHLLWTLVFGFDDGRQRSIAGLRRAYGEVAKESLSASAFYKRFSPALVTMLKACVDHAIEAGLGVAGRLTGPLAAFRDVTLLDSTVLRLHTLLAQDFPGCRTTTAPAAAKLHLVYSVRAAGRGSIQLTSERTPDLRTVIVGEWVRGHLLMFDLGYFSYELFDRITHHGGVFVTRLKRHVNLEILSVERGDRRGARRRVFREWLAHSRAPLIDLWVAMPTQRCASARWSSQQRRPMRIVGVRTDKGYELYFTNASSAQLPAADLPAVYAARWEIELLFREWKSHYRLEDLPSEKRVVVEALLYASMLTLLVSRRLANAIRDRLGRDARRVRNQRWARIFESLAPRLLWIVTRSRWQSAALERHCAALLMREARDPNAGRLALIECVERRKHARFIRERENRSNISGF